MKKLTSARVGGIEGFAIAVDTKMAGIRATHQELYGQEAIILKALLQKATEIADPNPNSENRRAVGFLTSSALALMDGGTIQQVLAQFPEYRNLNDIGFNALQLTSGGAEPKPEKRAYKKKGLARKEGKKEDQPRAELTEADVYEQYPPVKVFVNRMGHDNLVVVEVDEVFALFTRQGRVNEKKRKQALGFNLRTWRLEDPAKRGKGTAGDMTSAQVTEFCLWYANKGLKRKPTANAWVLRSELTREEETLAKKNLKQD